MLGLKEFNYGWVNYGAYTDPKTGKVKIGVIPEGVTDILYQYLGESYALRRQEKEEKETKR